MMQMALDATAVALDKIDAFSNDDITRATVKIARALLELVNAADVANDGSFAVDYTGLELTSRIAAAAFDIPRVIG